MTCPTCRGPGPSWRSSAAGLAVEGCSRCHGRWRARVLAGMAPEIIEAARETLARETGGEVRA